MSTKCSIDLHTDPQDTINKLPSNTKYTHNLCKNSERAEIAKYTTLQNSDKTNFQRSDRCQNGY